MRNIHRLSRPGDSPDDDAAHISELSRKLAEIQAIAPEAQAIELHELRFVDLQGHARPERVDVVRLAAGRHGDGHDRLCSKIERTADGIHGGADGPRPRPAGVVMS